MPTIKINLVRGDAESAEPRDVDTILEALRGLVEEKPTDEVSPREEAIAAIRQDVYTSFDAAFKLAEEKTRDKLQNISTKYLVAGLAGVGMDLATGFYEPARQLLTSEEAQEALVEDYGEGATYGDAIHAEVMKGMATKGIDPDDEDSTVATQYRAFLKAQDTLFEALQTIDSRREATIDVLVDEMADTRESAAALLTYPSVRMRIIDSAFGGVEGYEASVAKQIRAMQSAVQWCRGLKNAPVGLLLKMKTAAVNEDTDEDTRKLTQYLEKPLIDLASSHAHDLGCFGEALFTEYATLLGTRAQEYIDAARAASAETAGPPV